MYLRLSEDRAGDELGVERQRTRVRQLVDARGWQLGREHVDNDRSAAGKAARPAFEALLGRVEAGEVQVVVAWSLDRLTRNRRDQLRLFEACEQHKVLISLVEGSDIDMSSFAGQLVGDILAGQARAEIRQKSKRQVEANEQAARLGKRRGGRKPFGYTPDGLTIVEEEAAAIRKAYDDLINGVSLGQIARDWNEAGLRSGQTHWRDGQKGSRGEPTDWQHDTVRLVLRNPRNAGIRAYKGREVGPAEWPAIVPEYTYRAAMDVLSSRPRHTGGPGRFGQQLLTGVALCGVCTATVHAGGGHTADRRHRTYRCSGALGHISRKLEPIDAYVGEVMIGVMSSPTAADLLINRKRADVDELRRRVAALRVRRDALAVDYASDDGVFTLQQFKIATRSLNEQISAIESEMEDAGRAELLKPLINVDDVAAAWWHLHEKQRARARAIVAAVLEVIIHPVGRGARTFRPESVTITRRE